MICRGGFPGVGKQRREWVEPHAWGSSAKVGKARRADSSRMTGASSTALFDHLVGGCDADSCSKVTPSHPITSPVAATMYRSDEE